MNVLIVARVCNSRLRLMTTLNAHKRNFDNARLEDALFDQDDARVLDAALHVSLHMVGGNDLRHLRA